MHRILIDDMPGTGEVYRVAGEEARHAVRVKRLEAEEAVELLDGRGRVASASVRGAEKAGGEWVLVVEVERVEKRARVRPRVEVLAAAPKGDRLEEMIDGLSQVGAASWSLLRTARRGEEPRGNRVERLHRVAREAAKQCGRAWALEIGEAVEFGAAVTPAAAEGGAVVMADASGSRFEGGMVGSECGVVRLLIGPEGGWDAREVERARSAGAVVCCFGPHVMRVEEAAVVGAGVLLHEMWGRGAG